MPNSMTFQKEGDYIVCYINGKEVSRAKKTSDGTDEQEVIDIINDQIKVNPQLEGTEPNLTGFQKGDDKYKNPTYSTVVANPTLAGTEPTLNGLKINNDDFHVFNETDDLLTDAEMTTLLSEVFD